MKLMTLLSEYSIQTPKMTPKRTKGALIVAPISGVDLVKWM
jgi:hypothetical protein